MNSDNADHNEVNLLLGERAHLYSSSVFLMDPVFAMQDRGIYAITITNRSISFLARTLNHSINIRLCK